MKLPVREFDAVVIGAGGAGMRAALQISRADRPVHCSPKCFPTRSHTVSAQGGITVALGNSHEDNWEWHMYDTVKGSDYIGDQDAIEYMCKTSRKRFLSWSTWDCRSLVLTMAVFISARLAASRRTSAANRRRVPQQRRPYRSRPAARSVSAEPEKPHHYLLRMVRPRSGEKPGRRGSRLYRPVHRDRRSGLFKARATVLATGGAGRIYQSTTNAHINTGDGVGMAIRAGVPVQDMEMWQFHPTGIAGAGVLVTEGCRGEGGYLLNKHGERFMERYAPNAKDLAGRDVVARSIMIEIREGRGCDGPWGPHAKLKLDHLGKEVLESRLPGILELSRTFAHVDPVKEPIPVIPTCHYMMGGIPTKVTGQALTVNEKGEDVVIPGLFAVGEIACVSVHGANRLGGNSLLDLVVFGRAAGLHLQESIAEQGTLRDASESDIEGSLDRLNRWNNTRSGEDPVAIRKALQECMQHNFSVFREGDAMHKGLEQLKVIRERLKNARLDDTSSEFNTQRVECLELDNLMETAYATAVSANFRTESRGAHQPLRLPGS